MTPERLVELGYEHPRQLPDGRWIAGMRLLFTYGLVVDIDEIGWRTRYCYEFYEEALKDIKTWDGQGDPPGKWIKQKPENRLNPNWIRE